MAGNYYKPGDWNAICDICGFRFKASELTKNWKGEYVCKPDFEPRHPQTYIRVPHEDISVPWTRPEGEDEFIQICWLWERSAYADLGTADCMLADYVPNTYIFLYILKNGESPPPTINQNNAIPGYAIPGYAIPSQGI